MRVYNRKISDEKIQKSGVQNFVEFCSKKLGRAPPCPILLWDTILILKKISGDFGVSPATVYRVRPATFLESAQNFDQNGPKYASGIDFTTQNVARYWCNTKKK